jgi:hypothetical protein
MSSAETGLADGFFSVKCSWFIWGNVCWTSSSLAAGIMRFESERVGLDDSAGSRPSI